MKKYKLKQIIVFAVVLLLTTILYAQKPRIMVFPANVWMAEKGFVKTINNQGSSIEVMDYQKALNNNKELYSVINTISSLMNERGYPLEDLAATLKTITEQTALDNMDQNQGGEGIAESPRDKLLKVAKPDIVLEVFWNVYQTGPKKSITFELKGIDSGTNKPIASAGGTGNPSFSAELPVLLREAVLSHMDNFNTQLMTHFDDMFTNGREISLNIKVWDGSPKKLNDEINDDGDELKDDLKKWVKNNSVKGKFNLTKSSNNMMSFAQIRIPMYGEDGSVFDADSFASNLRKYIRKEYKIQSESSAIGLGLAEVVIGGKR